MLTQRVLIQILGDITYKDCGDGIDRVVSGWRWGTDGNAFWIQHWQMLPDCTSGLEEEQRGRKWRISKYATIGEVIQSALAAILMFEEHEAREGFRYRGARLYGPHMDHKALATVASLEEELRE